MKLPINCGNAPKAALIEKDKKYSWCTCGLSVKQAFCDGTHKKGSGMKALVFQSETTEAKYLWMRKQTKTPPYCDGTHNNL